MSPDISALTDILEPGCGWASILHPVEEHELLQTLTELSQIDSVSCVPNGKLHLMARLFRGTFSEPFFPLLNAKVCKKESQKKEALLFKHNLDTVH